MFLLDTLKNTAKVQQRFEKIEEKKSKFKLSIKCAVLSIKNINVVFFLLFNII